MVLAAIAFASGLLSHADMTQTYKHSLKDIRIRLQFDLDLETLANQLFHLTDSPEVRADTFELTDSANLQHIAFWLGCLNTPDSIACQQSNIVNRASRPRAEQSTPVNILRLFNLDHSDFFFGCAEHNKHQILFFYFKLDQTGLIVRIRNKGRTVEFMRNSLVSEREFLNALN